MRTSCILASVDQVLKVTIANGTSMIVTMFHVIPKTHQLSRNAKTARIRSFAGAKIIGPGNCATILLIRELLEICLQKY